MMNITRGSASSMILDRSKGCVKVKFFNYPRSIPFCFGVFSNLSQQKSPTAEILCKHFLETIVRKKYLCKISAVGLFCCYKFEETPKQKVIDLGQLKKIYFSDTVTPSLNEFLTSAQVLHQKKFNSKFCQKSKNLHKKFLEVKLAKNSQFSML